MSYDDSNYQNFIDIKDHGIIVKMTPINKGYESARKYYVETACGKQFFLRIVDKRTDFASIRWEFDMQRELFSAGVSMPQPLAIGSCNEGTYLLFDWINGKPFVDVLPCAGNAELYLFGIEIGENLKKIHSTPPFMPIVRPKAKSRCAKLWQAVALRTRSGLLDELNDYVNYIRFFIIGPHKSLLKTSIAELDYMKINNLKNSDCAKSQKQAICHGDFHLGNMLYDGEHVKIVDFSFTRSSMIQRSTLYEFARLSATLLPYDVNIQLGLLHGYFSGEDISDSVWKQILFYMSRVLYFPKIPNDGLINRLSLRAWLRRSANFMHFTDDLRSTRLLYYRKAGGPVDNVRNFIYKSCCNIELSCIHFEQLDSNNVQILPCRDYRGTEFSTSIKGTAKVSLEIFAELLASIMGENIRLSKHDGENIKETRVFTESCAGCTKYMENKWTFSIRFTSVSIGQMTLKGLQSIEPIVNYLREKDLLSANARWEVATGIADAHLYEDRILALAGGSAIEWLRD